MEIVKKYGNSIWRIPLISILGGLCYDPVYIKILMRFGISESGELNRIATLWASGSLVTGRFPAAAEFIAGRDFCFCSRCCHLWSAAFSDSTTYRQHNRACCNRIFVSVYPVELDGIFRRTVWVYKGKMGNIASFYPVASLSGSVSVYGIREKKEGMMSWEG